MMLKSHSYALAAIAVTFFLSGCGVNPVTNKTELQLISTSEEIAIGEKNYLPARQQQGGDYIIDPALTAYVQKVGNKLAAASDRDLPYEFVVLNDSVPNAWAMPGGKIAFNRGLLYELNSEAELAAVLSHEIVHAAARHGAQSMESSMLLQGAVAAAGIASQENEYSNLIVGGAQLSSQLISHKFGRDDESEADQYGMIYMQRAGYDPRAAVTLQETFLRLSNGGKSNFLDGLFASHPPSAERVAANKATLAELGEGGEWGREIYAIKVGKLKASKPAYEAYDAGKQALIKGDIKNAAALANKARKAEPREARFEELLGDVAMSQKNADKALTHYRKAIKMHPDYFRPYVQGGLALDSLGRIAEAEPMLKRSVELLPTATSFNLLGRIAEGKGDLNGARQLYEVAADSKSDVGKDASIRLQRLDLPRNPGKYLQASIKANSYGQLYAVVFNPTPWPIANVRVNVVHFNPRTKQPDNRTPSMLVAKRIEPNKSGRVTLEGIKIRSPSELKQYRVIIESVKLAK
ncbi:MAG: M48 family metalloprotease [Gallionella sp.]